MGNYAEWLAKALDWELETLEKRNPPDYDKVMALLERVAVILDKNLCEAKEVINEHT